jgi:two-component system chemotaxis sensor kinase CheA
VNEFLQQFVIESRELVDQASDGLLVLEQSPHDSERLDGVFRALHTLKGGAGIVEFPTMERLMHAAEEVLSEARSGKRTLTPALVGHCLAGLDQVLQWLDAVEQTGELPSGRDDQVDNIITRFVAAAPAAAPAASRASTESRAPESWVAQMWERNPAVRAEATTAVRFRPDPSCFFQGEDPLARATSLPQLLALELEPVTEWGPLDTFDTFTCNLVLTALTASSVDAVTEHMKGCSGACEIVAAAPADRVRDVLEAQLALLSDSNAQNFVGRIASAGSTAVNVLRFRRRNEDADTLARATERSLGEKTSQPLRDALAQLLAGGPSAVPGAVPEALEPSHRAESASRTLRVDAERVDALVRLTGELTVAKNGIGHIAKLAREGNDSVAGLLKERHDGLEHLVSELQRAVLGMRVLPMRTVFQRFPRVLREISGSLGKPVKLQLEGEDTEADKAIVEMLFEPLLHIVRNAIDHGIENPETRTARGKPPVATIRLRAARQGDQVLIEVSDDGGGIDVERVREVAKRRGVATVEALGLMTEADVVDLVFAPGFSTAETVTQLSGRGVGMDAVRTVVERVGGRVSLESRPGRGATVTFSLPFSVMMTHVVTVEAAGQLFGVPLDAVVETVRVPRNAIAGVGAAHAIVLRNRTIPVFELASVLGVGREAREDSEVLILIAAAAGFLGGIRVDRLGERMEVILQPLEGLLAGTPGITGTTLLGDGRVLLVLDIGELLQ